MSDKESMVGESGSLYMIADLPRADRPRERLLAHGPDAMNDAELLAILLRSGPRGCSTLDLSRGLLGKFDGNLEKLALAETNELQCIKGIGPAKAAELKAAFTLARRLASRIEPVAQKLSSPTIVAEHLYETFRGKKQEEVRVLLLDTRNQLIANRLVTKGLLTTSHVHPREVFRPAIREAAARIVLAHNHPSGDPEPSKQDLAVTETILKAGEVVGIPLVDHLIIGDKRQEGPFFVSLRQRGHCG